MNKNSIPKDVALKVKELINKAKLRGDIKPHTEAFKITPVKYEKHKGKISKYKE